MSREINTVPSALLRVSLMSYCDVDDLTALRTTCRALREHADAVCKRRVLVRYKRIATQWKEVTGRAWKGQAGTKLASFPLTGAAWLFCLRRTMVASVPHNWLTSRVCVGKAWLQYIPRARKPRLFRFDARIPDQWVDVLLAVKVAMLRFQSFDRLVQHKVSRKRQMKTILEHGTQAAASHKRRRTWGSPMRATALTGALMF